MMLNRLEIAFFLLLAILVFQALVRIIKSMSQFYQTKSRQWWLKCQNYWNIPVWAYQLMVQSCLYTALMVGFLTYFGIVSFSDNNAFWTTYYAFKVSDLPYLAFLVVLPLLSLSIFLFFRLFDYKGVFVKNFYQSFHNPHFQQHASYFWLSNWNYTLWVILWIILLPAFSVAINSPINFHIVVFLTNAWLGFDHFLQTKIIIPPYALFTHDENENKKLLANFLIIVNIVAVNMTISNFQFHFVFFIIILLTTKLFTKFIYSHQYMTQTHAAVA